MNNPNQTVVPFWENPTTQAVFDDLEQRHKRRIEEACREIREHLDTLARHPYVRAASELQSLLGLIALNTFRVEDAAKELP